MREGKPYAKLLLHGAQFLILVSLIQAVNTEIWYTGVVEVAYSDGLPEGSGVEVELEVDQKRADGSIHVDGFLTFMQWQTTRNDTTIPSDLVEEEKDFMELTPLSEMQEDVPLLSKVASALGLLIFGLTFFQIKNRAIIGSILNLLVLWIIISLVVLAPLGYIGGMEFGSGSLDREDDGESTVHQTTKGNSLINLIDGELEYEFVTKGYDLGLVNESNLDEVIAEAPGEDHRSYIEMDGVAGIHYSQFIVELVWAWLVLFTLAPMTIAFSNRVRIEKPQLL